MTELWTSAEAASFLGVASADVAGRVLRRAGVKPVARQPGRSGQNLWDADEVREFKASRPGRGARTDLTKSNRTEEIEHR